MFTTAGTDYDEVTYTHLGRSKTHSTHLYNMYFLHFKLTWNSGLKYLTINIIYSSPIFVKLQRTMFVTARPSNNDQWFYGHSLSSINQN